MLSLPLAFSGGRFFQGSGEFPWEGKSAWHGQGSIQDILLFFFYITHWNRSSAILILGLHQNRLQPSRSYSGERAFFFKKRVRSLIWPPLWCIWKYIEDTRFREDMNFMFSWQEHKIHIFEPTCNVLFIIWSNQFNKRKRRESWRHWTIRHSQRWHTENTPLGSRMKWRMECTSGLVPSKTLSSI